MMRCDASHRPLFAEFRLSARCKRAASVSQVTRWRAMITDVYLPYRHHAERRIYSECHCFPDMPQIARL